MEEGDLALFHTARFSLLVGMNTCNRCGRSTYIKMHILSFCVILYLPFPKAAAILYGSRADIGMECGQDSGKIISKGPTIRPTIFHHPGTAPIHLVQSC